MSSSAREPEPPAEDVPVYRRVRPDEPDDGSFDCFLDQYGTVLCRWLIETETGGRRNDDMFFQRNADPDAMVHHVAQALEEHTASANGTMTGMSLLTELGRLWVRRILWRIRSVPVAAPGAVPPLTPACIQLASTWGGDYCRLAVRLASGVLSRRSSGEDGAMMGVDEATSSAAPSRPSWMKAVEGWREMLHARREALHPREFEALDTHLRALLDDQEEQQASPSSSSPDDDMQ